nr:AI-2E family transporter [Lachnospiraceae bacterium]
GYGIGKFIVNIIIGIFVSVYVLMEKEKFKGQVKKLIYGVFSPHHGNTIMEVLRKANDIFFGFIIGKIIDSFIIGIICYVVMCLIGMPYAVLTSVIIGVTNIIPVFGPYIGAIPTVIIIFLTDPWMGIYFLIFVLILQQIDGNLIGPKILGDSTGISSFWVVLAIVVGGSLFGFMGMLLGVPTMALIYYIIGRMSNFLLRKRQLPEDTDRYLDLDHVDEETGKLITKDPEEEQKKERRKAPKFVKKKEE